MSELYIPAFLNTILWLLAFYYGSKFLFKWWLKRKINQHVKNGNASVNDEQAQNMRQEQGRVSIKKEQKPSSSSGGKGDYIDYEEVK